MSLLKNKINAHVLFISMITLSLSLFVVFFAKDKFISQEKLAVAYYKKYLLNKNALVKLKRQGEEKVCQESKKEQITLNIQDDYYRFYCVKKSLFASGKPTRNKYIEFERVEEVLDLNSEHIEISYISSLAELPESSEQDPKIVILKNAIDERLEKTFYGIIITDFYFNFTGRYNIYGALFSSFDNKREERKLAFKKTVIDNLEEKYSYWRYLPYSRNLFNHAE